MTEALLHDHTAATGLLWRVGVLALGDSAPDRGDHVVPGAVAVGDNALGRRADGNAFSLKILAQTVVELG